MHTNSDNNQEQKILGDYAVKFLTACFENGTAQQLEEVLPKIENHWTLKDAAAQERLARILASGSQKIQLNASIKNSSKDEMIRLLQQKTNQWLKKAIENGFRDKNTLLNSPEYALLRTNTEFQNLLEAIEAKK